MIYASNIFIFQNYLVLLLNILILNLLIKLFIFFIDFFFSLNLKLSYSLNRLVNFWIINLCNTFNLSILFIFIYLSWLSNKTIINRWHIILFTFVIKCKIMHFALNWSFCFHIQIRYINPISHSTFHYPL
jgi:hypothetical protein